MANQDNDELVLCTSYAGWSLHAPGSEDHEIANGDAPALLTGPGEPTADDYRAAWEALENQNHGRLVDYYTGEDIRSATWQEAHESRNDLSGVGAVDVDGRTCYVED